MSYRPPLQHLLARHITIWQSMTSFHQCEPIQLAEELLDMIEDTSDHRLLTEDEYQDALRDARQEGYDDGVLDESGWWERA